MALVLGSGERDAICLADELEAGVLLLDDRAARRVAKDRGLNVAGTLGLLDLADAVEALLRTSFRIRANLVRSVLEKRSAKGPRPE